MLGDGNQPVPSRAGVLDMRSHSLLASAHGASPFLVPAAVLVNDVQPLHSAPVARCERMHGACDKFAGAYI